MITSKSIAIIILLRDREAAHLAKVTLSEAAEINDYTVRFLVPPLSGLSFFEGDDDAIDEWWDTQVGGDALAVYVTEHEDGLERHVNDPHAQFFIGITQPEHISLYAGRPNVTPLAIKDPIDLALAVIQSFGAENKRNNPVLFAPSVIEEETPFSETLAKRGSEVLSPQRQPSFAPSGRRAPPQVQLPQRRPPTVDPGIEHPLELLANMKRTTVVNLIPEHASESASESPTRAEMIGVSATMHNEEPKATSAPLALIRRMISMGENRLRGKWPTIPTELIQQVSSFHPAAVIVVGGIKGGAGKTSTATGLAVALGEIADKAAMAVCLVDGNVNNPDAWTHFGIPDQAASVYDTIQALKNNLPLPAPAYSATAGLAIYPEARESHGYDVKDIQRLHQHLSQKFSVVVVDLANRAPSFSGGPEAELAEFWMAYADVLVLPMKTGQPDHEAIDQFLSLDRTLPPTIVPWIKPPARLSKKTLAKANAFVDESVRPRADVIMVPDDDRIVEATFRGVPAASLSKPLGAAYQDIAERVVQHSYRQRAS